MGTTYCSTDTPWEGKLSPLAIVFFLSVHWPQTSTNSEIWQHVTESPFLFNQKFSFCGFQCCYNIELACITMPACSFRQYFVLHWPDFAFCQREFWCTTHTLDRRLGTYSLCLLNSSPTSPFFFGFVRSSAYLELKTSLECVGSYFFVGLCSDWFASPDLQPILTLTARGLHRRARMKGWLTCTAKRGDSSWFICACLALRENPRKILLTVL